MTDRRALLADLERRLVGVGDARRHASWIAQHTLALGRAQIIAYPDAPVAPADADRARALADRRAAGEPLQYVLGEAHFFGLRLRVAPGVLIPRPETEQVVEAALERLGGAAAPRCLDVGTGSGAIALAIASARPDARVVACDVSADALAIARGNAEALGLAGRIAFAHADALAPGFPDALRAAAGLAPDARFDLLISNPPYVPDTEREAMQPEVRDHEPDLALFTGPDALVFYRAITTRAPALLVPGGTLAFETHADGMEAVADLLRAAGFAGVEARRDYAGLGRIVLGTWQG